ncbi:MAG: hypothetical protein ABEJ31_09925 [Haloarculaceae archaeon]
MSKRKRSPSGAGSPATPSLALDDAFELLRNERRRLVVEYVAEMDAETVDLGPLAESVAARELGTTVRALSAGERKRVYVGLYQCHLPKLDESGVIEFDPDRKTVAPAPATGRLAAYVATGSAAAPPRVDSRAPQYLAVAGAGVTLLAASGLGAGRFGLTPLLAAAFLVVAMTALAGWDTLAGRRR